MALRNYMQDLIRAQTDLNHDDHLQYDTQFCITIVDDNSSSVLPDDDCEEFEDYYVTLENRSLSRNSDTISLSSVDVDGTYRFMIGVQDEERDEMSRADANRMMLDGFRKRQRYLRETLSPKQAPSRSLSSMMQCNPSPLATQLTPTPPSGDELYDSDILRGNDSQRSRMTLLKQSLKERRRQSPPLF